MGGGGVKIAYKQYKINLEKSCKQKKILSKYCGGGGGGMNTNTNLYSKIKNEDPYASFFTGDCNGHSQFWWSDGDTTSEGMVIEDLQARI